jgi:NADH:ubiquinone oxidoreductase subunit 5 (subunit L)/multisubunit Na+/H+ antiporter MnhA subunit
LPAPPGLELYHGPDQRGRGAGVHRNLAWRLYLHKAGQPAPRPWRELLAQAFYLDRLQHWLLVRPYRAVAGFLWREVDDGGLDLGFMTLAQALGLISRGWAGLERRQAVRVFIIAFTGPKRSAGAAGAGLAGLVRMDSRCFRYPY